MSTLEKKHATQRVAESQLVDERSGASLRQRIRTLLSRTRYADFAVARIRVAGIDLGEDAFEAIERCRVLIGRLDAEALTTVQESGARDPATSTQIRRRIEVVREFLESGRLTIRAAGLTVWTPDFSVLREIEEHPTGHATIIGAHYLIRPSAVGGPSFTCILSDPPAVHTVRKRFEELWHEAYDVSGTIHEALDRIVDNCGELTSPHDVENL